MIVSFALTQSAKKYKNIFIDILLTILVSTIFAAMWPIIVPYAIFDLNRRNVE